eukprot:1140114-Pyramimonas_sp.AAC.1
MSCCSVHLVRQLAAWQTARRRSHRAILAPCRIFIETLAASGWSTSDLVGGSGSSGLASAAARPGTTTSWSGGPTSTSMSKADARASSSGGQTSPRGPAWPPSKSASSGPKGVPAAGYVNGSASVSWAYNATQESKNS